MRCANEHCIYNRDFECILNKIEINEFGACDSCIIAILDAYFLKTEKERQLQEIQNRY